MDSIQIAADWIAQAKGLVVFSGAGMGVDSGLPDFRGSKGFWKAYPHFEALGIRFQDAASPEQFEGDPHFGWGFYAHRLDLYRKTNPHRGFYHLQDWARRFNFEVFSVTSNVDGQFQKAGFAPNRVFEVHGSVHRLQCVRPCSTDIWDNDLPMPIEPESMRVHTVPNCPRCGSAARPNILMFGDPSWVEEHAGAQQREFDHFIEQIESKDLVSLEVGAGLAVPTIRMMTERYARKGVRTIRINPIDASIGSPHLSLQLGGKQAFSQINQLLSAS